MENAKATFYVATDGNDSWSGRREAANSANTDGPFATVQRARGAVRQLKAQTQDGAARPMTVMVRGGKYCLSHTLALTDKDSGTRECPVTWCAYPGETPILSGGRIVTGWQSHDDDILKAEVPGAKGGKWKTRQLFCNGQRMPRARWPKCDPANPRHTGWAFTEGPASVAGGCEEDEEDAAPRWELNNEDDHARAFRFPRGTFPRQWAKPSEAEAVVAPGWGWFKLVVPIERIDHERSVVVLRDRIWQLDRLPWSCSVVFVKNNRFYLENVLEELTLPGEWCLDTEEGVVYFRPPSADEDREVVLPALHTLIALHGASWITVCGFTFTETNDGDGYHRPGLDGYSGMFPEPGRRYCGEAVHLRNATHCCLEHNHFDAVGGHAIYLEQGCYRNSIRHNEISHAGASGICMLGNEVRHPMYNRVEDNDIHHVGELINFTAGVLLGLSDGNIIAHNAIHDTPHHGVNLATNGLGSNIIEYNEIRRVALETHDTGAINCWMDVPGDGRRILRDAQRAGHIIRNNLIADVEGCLVDQDGNLSADRSARGIYLDDCSSNCLVSGNIIMRVGTGMQLHCCQHNIIENNMFIDCQTGIWDMDGVSIRSGLEELHNFRRGHRIVRNIFVLTGESPFLYLLLKWNHMLWQESDHNVFFVKDMVEDELLVMRDSKKTQPFREWCQETGFDAHSICADPRLIDPENDDFRLQPDSPALELGFLPIDVSTVGIRKKT